MASSQNAQGHYLNILKQLLKRKGFTYADLAVAMHMTESGIKKMLNAKDISLGRLAQLSQPLGLTPAQLMSFAEQTSIPVITLTREQEEFLLSKDLHLKVYWRFVVEGLSADAIVNRERTTLKDITVVLERLVSKKLIRRHRQKYQRLQEGKFRFDENSEFVKKLNREWSELTLSRSLKDQEKSLQRLITTKMSEKSFLELKQRIENTALDIAQQSHRDEMNLKQSELKNVSLLFALVPQGVLDSSLD
jgi:transcriptional regulator with XRE-family HTH domain